MPTSKKNVYTIVLHNTKKVLGAAEPSAENGCPVLLQECLFGHFRLPKMQTYKSPGL